MIVHRRVYRAKSVCEEKMVNFTKEVFAQTPWPNTMRIYRIHTGEFNQVAVELEADSLATFEATWNEWASVAFTEDSARQWEEIDSGLGWTEFWTIE